MRFVRFAAAATLVLVSGFPLAAQAQGEGVKGYYRQPTIRGGTVVFVAEGDLWKFSLPAGAAFESKEIAGVATRLTSHPGDEGSPRLSPDGTLVAFTAQYEGPQEVYVMPVSGGLPRRLTWDGLRCDVVGWKGNQVLVTTERHSTLPNWQLVLVDAATGASSKIPLDQAAEGDFGEKGELYFTRLRFQGSHTKRYTGGTAQNLWKFEPGAAEAVALTADFPGTSAAPMWWNGRLYFASDRDGTMEVWSMNPEGGDLRQHTFHDWLDVKSPAMDAGRVVFQLGADLHLLDVGAERETPLALTLDSDFDQMREKWIKKPLDWTTSAAISPAGDKVALTARGQVFVAPKGQGRLVEVTRRNGVRYRAARFMPDGNTLVMLSDESGEVEVWTAPANGVGEPTQLTKDGTILRWEAVPSPDGRFLAHHDKNQELWIFDKESGVSTKVDTDKFDNFDGLRWSPDSRWLAYIGYEANLNRTVRIYGPIGGEAKVHRITTDRYDSHSAAWSPDGKWLYLLSDRNLESVVSSPWGPMAPEPFFDKKTRVYAVALKPGTRFPFQPADELMPKEEPKAEKKPEKPEPAPAPEGAAQDEVKPGDQPGAEKPKEEKQDAKKDEKPKVAPIEIEIEGIRERLYEVPAPPGNYSSLACTEKRIFWLSSPSDSEAKTDLHVLEITPKEPEVKALVKDLMGYELSLDGKSILVRKRGSLSIIESGALAPASLDKAGVDLSQWSFPLVPREEWKQMFRESWRLMRDYFYDRGMHGVDWKAMLEKYEPMVERVSSRAELSDLMAQMVGELSALHHFVYGGDLRQGDDLARPASLGAELAPDAQAGGLRVVRIHPSDPDEPQRRSPLARPGVDVKEGDVIVAVNGVSAAGVMEIGQLLRNQAGRQVLLTVRSGETPPRDVIVVPISSADDSELRYHGWQHTRRMMVEEAGAGAIGYVHLKAMGRENIAEFFRGFYPVFNRKGLIIDVRHNRGGNIDSWVLSRLLRKAWFYWQPRVGDPFWNMQFAFRGHVVVLCNERTASDGEAFAEGARRLGIGTVMGTRTWGGEIWLSSSNTLVDRGIATAAEIGVYGPEGEWLIEGHGVEPDIVVDNPPHATFKGEDAQLRAAVEHLKKKIAEQPVEVPPPPKHPDKSYRPGGR